jgi:hypothetical protein
MSIHNETARLANNRSPARLTVGADEVLAMVYMTDSTTSRRTPESEERARRLVACWNALVGLSTEDVEAMASENAAKRATLESDERATFGQVVAADVLA